MKTFYPERFKTQRNISSDLFRNLLENTSSLPLHTKLLLENLSCKRVMLTLQNDNSVTANSFGAFPVTTYILDDVAADRARTLIAILNTWNEKV